MRRRDGRVGGHSVRESGVLPGIDAGKRRKESNSTRPRNCATRASGRPSEHAEAAPAEDGDVYAAEDATDIDGTSDDESAPSECVIKGTKYASGEADPDNACESCQPSVSVSSWSDEVDGTSCGSNGICHTGACVSGCEIAGVYYAAAATNSSNGCETCQPAKSRSAWSNVGDGTGCGNSQVCSSGQCGTQCDIGGTVVASGAADPSNSCQSCQPGANLSSWSNLSDGTSCGSDWIRRIRARKEKVRLRDRECFHYVAAATNPANACQSCQPELAAWRERRRMD